MQIARRPSSPIISPSGVGFPARHIGRQRRFLVCFRETPPGIHPAVAGDLKQPNAKGADLTQRRQHCGPRTSRNASWAASSGQMLLTCHSSTASTADRFPIRIHQARECLRVAARRLLNPDAFRRGMHVCLAPCSDVRRILPRFVGRIKRIPPSRLRRSSGVLCRKRLNDACAAHKCILYSKQLSPRKAPPP